MSPTQKIRLYPFRHRQQDVVVASFEYDASLVNMIKQLPGACWSRTLKSWYFPKDIFDLHRFFEAFKEVAYTDYSALKSNSLQVSEPEEDSKTYPPRNPVELPKGYLEMLDQKRYSDNTKKIYTAYMRDFMVVFKGRDIEKISKEQINQYILWLIKTKDISASQQNQRINAIKFYYEKVLGGEKHHYQIERPRKKRHLPDVLSKEEIGKMLMVSENSKHKCLLALLYSCGLRRSEAINLRIEDIDSKRMLIKVKGAKGDKDRYVPLSKHLLFLFREYFKEYKPKEYLFTGQGGTLQYSGESISKVVKAAAIKAGINKRVYPHILRHSFATHHLEQGTDLRFIQELLGHESSKTTERYTHVAQNHITKIKNPMDDIFENST